MAVNVMYRFRARWGERLTYWLAQAAMLAMMGMMLAFLREHFPSDSVFPPLSYVIGYAIWAYAAATLRRYRDSLLAYKRLQKEQWERDAERLDLSNQ